MTAPTSDRARMIADLKDFIAPCSDGDGNADWHLASAIIRVCENLIAERMAQPSGKAGELDTRARVLVEELGGREVVKFATADDDMRIDGWNKVCQALWSAYPNMNAAMQAAPVHDRPALAIRQFAAQQRENAETIQALRERVATAERVKKFLSDRLEHHLRIQNVCAEQQGAAEMRENWANIRANKEAEISRGALIQKEEAIARAEAAERANTELDNARKSAEQSARDLRENNATLRAELDAIKGAQPSDTDIVQVMNRLMQKFRSLPMAYDSPMARAYVEAVRSLLSAPALPVVGACVKNTDGTYSLWARYSYQTQEDCEAGAKDHARKNGGATHVALLGAPLPTEGGK